MTRGALAGALLLAAWSLNTPLPAADFEIGTPAAEENPRLSGTRKTPAPAPAASEDEEAAAASPASALPAPGPKDLPVWLAAGDVPTAFPLRKYELRTDFALYEGGGILSKAYLGLFPRFFLGGAADLRGFIGSANLHMDREDAQLLARFALLLEDAGWPALALGWEGPGYQKSGAKGLYIAASKQFPTRLANYQLHAVLNSANVETFTGQDLRGSLALSTAYRALGFFSSLDECFGPAGPRWSAGVSAFFSPITLSLEFRDLASLRQDASVSRLLRVAWLGRF